MCPSSTSGMRQAPSWPAPGTSKASAKCSLREAGGEGCSAGPLITKNTFLEEWNGGRPQWRRSFSEGALPQWPEPPRVLPEAGKLLRKHHKRPQSKKQKVERSPVGSKQVGVVVQAVRSLYKDGVRPTGVLLKRRISQMLGDVGEASTKAKPWWQDMAALLEVCEAGTGQLLVQQSGGAEQFNVLLQGVEPDFVEQDGEDGAQPASPEMERLVTLMVLFLRRAATTDFVVAEYLSRSVMGSPYSCGEWLRVVKKMTKAKKIGYTAAIVKPDEDRRSSWLVPYSFSTRAKRLATCGERVQLVGSPEGDKVRKNICTLLQEHETIATSNLKKMYKDVFGEFLDEALFGYTKLKEFLQCAEMQEVCTTVTQAEEGSRGAKSIVTRPGGAVGAAGMETQPGHQAMRCTSKTRVA